MSEFKKNPIATDEDYFKLSDNVYNKDFLHEEAKIKGSNGQEWKVIETFDADDTKVKNGLQAIAVVPVDKDDPNKLKYDDVIIAFRGTEFNRFDGDKTTDIVQITLGQKKNLGVAGEKVPTSFDSALGFAEKIKKKYNPTSIHTTGHSKGAAEAQYVAAEMDCYATTYAAPNIYRLLSDKAKRRVDEGVMENKVVDYTHRKDAVGNFEQFGAPMIGKQFTTKSNGTDSFLAAVFMGQHPMSTFSDMFHNNGSARLELEPDDIIRHAKEIQKISDILSDIVKNIERFQQQEEDEIAKLKSQLKHETGPGGKYHLLEEHEVDEAIKEVAKISQNGKDYFHDVQLAEELIHLLRKKQKELIHFGDDIAYAANSLRDKDNQLGTNFEGLAVR
ncbi:putative Cytosolic Protein [Bacillus thuringiensis MC28]|nr:putative Cytosolic Protein [Bacillus thuringiensis MC28]